MISSTNGGTIFISTASGSTGTGNDNNTISNCKIGPAGTNLPSKGIYANGTTTNSNAENSGILITNNEIFDFFLPTQTHGGIMISSGNTDYTISNNKLYQTGTRTFTGTNGNPEYGIYFSSTGFTDYCQITGEYGWLRFRLRNGYLDCIQSHSFHAYWRNLFCNQRQRNPAYRS